MTWGHSLIKQIPEGKRDRRAKSPAWRPLEASGSSRKRQARFWDSQKPMHSEKYQEVKGTNPSKTAGFSDLFIPLQQQFLGSVVLIEALGWL